MRAICLAVVLIGIAAEWNLAADTYPRQPGIDAVHYRFRISLNDALDRIDAEADVTVRVEPMAREVALDLVSASDGKGMTVGAVTRAGTPVQFAHDNNRLRLQLPGDRGSVTDITFTVSYAGVPRDGLLPFTNIHGDKVMFSEGWPNRARHWLPMIDHPSDKATGEMIVTAPAQYQVASNGVLVEEVDLDHARRRTHWRQSVPIASWLFAVGVARFDVHHAGLVHGVPLQTWTFPQDRDAGRELFEETSRRALDFFSRRVGPYPYDKLANVQASGFGGGMENATVIFYGEKAVAAGRGPVVHEIAHQWFGNSVTERDWDEVWLSEGFATYLALLFTEHDKGRDAFVAALRRDRETIIAATTKRPDAPVIHRNIDDLTGLLSPLVYEKAGWVLHMLRGEVGDDMFWTGLREYYRRYRDGNASTDEFRAVMERASGQDLQWFFSQWLTRGGIPRLEMSWQYDQHRQGVEVTVAQVQPGPLYRLHVDLGVEAPGGNALGSSRLEITGARATHFIAVAAPPAAVRVDGATWLLADLREVK